MGVVSEHEDFQSGLPVPGRSRGLPTPSIGRGLPLPLPNRDLVSSEEPVEDEPVIEVEDEAPELEEDEASPSFEEDEAMVASVDFDDSLDDEGESVGEPEELDFESTMKESADDVLQRILMAQDNPDANFGAHGQDPLAEFDLDLILHEAIRSGASDVHLTPGDYVAFTVLGDIVREPRFGLVTPTITQKLHFEIITKVLEKEFVENLELDTSYTVTDGPSRGRRTRLSIGKSFEEVILNFRIISDDIPTPEDLGVTGSLLNWASLPNGLILMNGPTGTGKALPLGAPVMTPDGVVELRDVRVGSELVSSSGESCRVTSMSPVNNTPKLFKFVLGDGKEFFADHHHQWWVSAPGWCSARESWERFRNIAELAVVLELSGYGTRFVSFDDFVAIVAEHESLRGEFPSADWVKSALGFAGVHLRGDGTSLNEFLHGLLCKLFYRLTHFAGFGSTPFDDEELMCFTTEELVLLQEYSLVNIPRVGGQFTSLVALERVYPGDVGYEPVRCVTVDSLDHSYVCYGDVITHNSTTLASIIKRKQETSAEKIITVESPVEFQYGTEGKALVWQREVGRDTRSFANAMKSAMRQAPDTMVIGEVRDRREIDALLFAAETGHLAISTMHTNSASATVSRIKSLFIGDEQARVMATLADVSRGYANQVLLKSLSEDSRFAVREVLEFNPEVSKLLSVGDVEGIRNYQIENEITLEHNLVKAISEGKCSVQEARSKSSYPLFFDELVEGLG